MDFSCYSSRHFQMRMKRFYSRLCHNPWRKNILYIGDPLEIPSLSSSKSLYWGTTTTTMLDQRAFTLWVSSYDELPFGDCSIDVIICNFEKIPESASFLNECHRILKNEGKCIWTIRNPYSPFYFGSSDKNARSAFEAKSLLTRYDFDILSVKSHSFLARWASRWLVRLSLKWEKWLTKFCPFFANRISFIAIKRTAHYSPLPSYLRLSQRVLWESPCQL